MVTTDARVAAASVVLLGEPLAVLDSDPVPLEVATTLQLRFGGSEFNTAVGLARLGLRPVLTTSVGGDVFSRRLARVARQEGVELVTGRAKNRPIGAMFKDVARSGADTFYLRKNSAFSAATVTDFAGDVLSPPPDWFHTSGITWAVNEQLARAILQRAARADATVSFDVNLRPALQPAASARRMFAEVVGMCDVVLLSRLEALTVTGAPTIEAAVSRIADAVGRAVVRNGPEPLLAIEDGVVEEIPIVPVAEVDPIGAGDAFDAGFIAGTLHGMAMQDSCRLGAELAGEVVGVHGDWGFSPRVLDGTSKRREERATWRT